MRLLRICSAWRYGISADTTASLPQVSAAVDAGHSISKLSAHGHPAGVPSSVFLLSDLSFSLSLAFLLISHRLFFAFSYSMSTSTIFATDNSALKLASGNLNLVCSSALKPHS